MVAVNVAVGVALAGQWLRLPVVAVDVAMLVAMVVALVMGEFCGYGGGCGWQ